VFRDPSAWYHLVFSYDTTLATASDRCQIWVNGVRQTAFSTSIDPSLNLVTYYKTGQLYPYIGAENRDNTYLNGFDGYLAETYFIDGQALTPASFGSTNALTGVWQPAPYTGTYGTNGFYLKFTDNSTAAALGTDFSGNSNTWTVNNISVTAGVTYDSMTDVPTLTSATAANYAVLNPLSAYVASTLSEGNLKLSAAGSAIWYPAAASIQIPTTGKYHCEFTIGASDAGLMRHYIGIITDTFPISTATGIGSSSQGWGYFANDGGVYNNGGVVATLSTATTNDVIGVAFDSDAGTLQFYKNGSAMGSALTGFTSKYYFAAACFGVATGFINFGQRPFAYTPPTGFVALNTFNLPASTIVKGNTVMDATTYTGTGAIQTVTNAGGFQPDLLWVKVRSRTGFHDLVDSVRGVNRVLASNATDAEATGSFITSLNSNGFTLPANTTSDAYYTNVSGETFVGWQWQAGQGSSSSNTSGSITSTVSVNATAGFSIATYTGTGANATVGHGLGVAPKMVFVKRRNTTANWAVWQSALAGTDYLNLNTTAAAATAASVWNSTVPTSSVISIGTDTGTNASASTYVAYCWSEIAGFSKFGSYVGNGSADGPFIYTGFEPKFILSKRINTTGNWNLLDGTRDPYNAVGTYLYANASDAEGANASTLDFTANGFKIRQTYGDWNVSGSTYVYAVFAENPFKNALAR
jgi:hypothetical protein